MTNDEKSAPDTPRDDQRAVEFSCDSLKGKGEKKLRALHLDVLCAMAEAIGACVSEEARESKDCLVKLLLKKKRQVSRAKKEEAAAAAVATEEASEDPKGTTERSSIWKPRYTLKICAFNALKLRLDKQELCEDWRELICYFAKNVDVILLSEVPASNSLFNRRVAGLLRRLNAETSARDEDRNWSYCCSDASGPGAPELHVILCRSPVRAIRHQTLKSIGSIQMDHAPFCALLEDSRAGGVRVAVTSVHMPPASRSRERDVQINRLFEMYGGNGEASVRLDTPFTAKGARDAKTPFVAHVLAGDWNAWIGDPRYGAEKHGFEVLFGRGTETTAGKKAFDNFALSKDTRDYYTIASRVLEFATHHNSRLSIASLSDHSPVLLELERAA
jgi:endonuclease/exonuclease/phosphatase family metal-dependent hydrolase